MIKLTEVNAIKCFIDLRDDRWKPFRQTLQALFNENTKLLIASRDEIQIHRLQGQLELLLKLMDTIENADRLTRSK